MKSFRNYNQRSGGVLRPALSAVAVALVLTACVGGGDPSPDDLATGETEVPPGVPDELTDLYLEAVAEGGRLTYYGSSPLFQLRAFEEHLAQAMPGLDFTFVRVSTAGGIERVEAEIESGNIIGDVIDMLDPVWYRDMHSRGLLRQFESDNWDEWPDEYKEEGYYYAGGVALAAVLYNSNAVPDGESLTWTDLPSFGNRAGTWDPRTGGAGVNLVHGIHQVVGPEWWGDMSGAGAQFFLGAGGQARLAAGELDVLAGSHGAGCSLKEEGQPVDVAYPDEGVFAGINNIAIVEGTRNPKGAELIARYLMTPEGQELRNLAVCVYSVRSGVAQHEFLPPLDSLNVLDISADSVAEHHEAYLAEALAAAGLE